MGERTSVRDLDPASAIPAERIDLLERPLVGRLSTLMPNGYPQTHPVWYDFDGLHVRVNTMRGFRKERNMRADPRVTLLVIDPANADHWIEVRGLVELTEEGAAQHLDSLAWRYEHVEHFFGGAIDARFAGQEFPVLGRISVVRVLTDLAANAQKHQQVKRQYAAGPAARITGTSVAIPDSHRELFSTPLVDSLTTLMPSGQPQTQLVWVDLDGDCVRVNTTRERQKGRNLEAVPRCTVLAVDLRDSGRWIEVRGDAELIETGAVQHLDQLTRLYTCKPQFYGWIYPEEFRERETRIICRIHPRHVVCDAIHH